MASRNDNAAPARKLVLVQSSNPDESLDVGVVDAAFAIRTTTVTIDIYPDWGFKVDPYSGAVHIAPPRPYSRTSLAAGSDPDPMPDPMPDADSDDEDDEVVVKRPPRKKPKRASSEEPPKVRRSTRVTRRCTRYSPDEDEPHPPKIYDVASSSDADFKSGSESESDSSSDSESAEDEDDDDDPYAGKNQDKYTLEDGWMVENDPDDEPRAPCEMMPAVMIHRDEFFGVNPKIWFARNIWHKDYATIMKDPYFRYKIWAQIETMVNNMGHGSRAESHRARNYILWSLTQSNTDVYYYRHKRAYIENRKCDFCRYDKRVTRTWLFYKNTKLAYKMRIGFECHLRFKAILRIFQCLWGATGAGDAYFNVYGAPAVFRNASEAWAEIDRRILNAMTICEIVAERQAQLTKKDNAKSAGGTKKYIRIKPGDPGYDSWDSDTCNDPVDEGFDECKYIYKAPMHDLP